MANDVAAGLMLPTELDESLTRLAAMHGKSKAALVCEALAEFVAHEEAYLASIEEARAAIRAGDFVSHEEVVRQTEEMLARGR